MKAKVIEGFAIAKDLRAQCRRKVLHLVKRGGTRPRLAVVLLGDDPASLLYIGNKFAACKEAGIETELHNLPLDTSEDDLVALIERLNTTEQVHAILVQLPLPGHILADKVFRTIAFQKDVDGFHLLNMGGLLVGEPLFPPCTPAGIVKKLEIEAIPIAGSDITIVGAGTLVGKPPALMLMGLGATVTICQEQVQAIYDLVKPSFDDRAAPDVTAQSVVTNRFVDPAIGLP